MASFVLSAQNYNSVIIKGNDAYKKGDYKTAQLNYQQVLKTNPSNLPAMFNLGNTLQRQKNAGDASKQYDAVIAASTDSSIKSKAYYNKGLSLIAQQKLTEAIESFKQSLLLSPTDNDTRENLQKAMNDLRQQQQKQSSQQQPQNKKQQPKENKLTQQKAEQYLQQLSDEEKRLQKELQVKQQSTEQQQDW